MLFVEDFHHMLKDNAEHAVLEGQCPRLLDDCQMTSKLCILFLSWTTTFNAQKAHARPLLVEAVGLRADRSGAKLSEPSLPQNLHTPKLFEMLEPARQILPLQLTRRFQREKSWG